MPYSKLWPALDCGPGMARDRLSRAQEVLEQACDSQAELAEITIADIIDSAINGLHNGD